MIFTSNLHKALNLARMPAVRCRLFMLYYVSILAEVPITRTTCDSTLHHKHDFSTLLAASR